MEIEVVAFVMNVSRQATNPAAAKAGPEEGADGGKEQAGDDEEFSGTVHGYTVKFVSDLSR